MFIVGIIGVAYVLRYRVTELEKFKGETEKWQTTHDADFLRWREDHGRVHLQQAEILATLRTLVEESQRRLSWLENGHSKGTHHGQ
jgi:hypothetical protein